MPRRRQRQQPLATAGISRTHCGFIPIGNQRTSPRAAAASSEPAASGSQYCRRAPRHCAYNAAVAATLSRYVLPSERCTSVSDASGTRYEAASAFAIGIS